MRVAFLTDVHGNLPALEAVLSDARQQGADLIWDGGDAVGYHPWPNECVHLLAEACAVTIRGNYDRKVLMTPERQDRWRRRKDPLKAEALIWAFAQLDARARTLLAGRPDQARPPDLGLPVLVCHGSPASRQEPLGPATLPVRWQELAVAAEASLVLHGHTHLPHTRYEATTLFVNPGACGRSEDGDPRAAYVLVDFANRRPEILLQRVAYDTGLVGREVRRRGLPPVFAIMAERGISLSRARRLLSGSDAR